MFEFDHKEANPTATRNPNLPALTPSSRAEHFPGEWGQLTVRLHCDSYCFEQMKAHDRTFQPIGTCAWPYFFCGELNVRLLKLLTRSNCCETYHERTKLLISVFPRNLAPFRGRPLKANYVQPVNSILLDCRCLHRLRRHSFTNGTLRRDCSRTSEHHPTEVEQHESKLTPLSQAPILWVAIRHEAVTVLLLVSNQPLKHFFPSRVLSHPQAIPCPDVANVIVTVVRIVVRAMRRDGRNDWPRKIVSTRALGLCSLNLGDT